MKKRVIALLGLAVILGVVQIKSVMVTRKLLKR